ncbi:MAG: transcriptional repressor [Deltaproteobacteria bacterium]|nr:MAG: transcriptional repressor [Deltaproteobacteria bacterium]
MEQLSEKALHHLLRERGLKATRQRDEIVRALREAGAHVTVDELYRRVRQKNPNLGYATVYRTLRLLSESGWASARRFGDRTARFEHRVEGEHHDHLICLRCGKIQEFENDRLEKLQERIARRQGFRVQEHKLELYGYCQDCGENQKSSPSSRKRKAGIHE